MTRNGNKMLLKCFFVALSVHSAFGFPEKEQLGISGRLANGLCLKLESTIGGNDHHSSANAVGSTDQEYIWTLGSLIDGSVEKMWHVKSAGKVPQDRRGRKGLQKMQHLEKSNISQKGNQQESGRDHEDDRNAEVGYAVLDLMENVWIFYYEKYLKTLDAKAFAQDLQIFLLELKSVVLFEKIHREDITSKKLAEELTNIMISHRILGLSYDLEKISYSGSGIRRPDPFKWVKPIDKFLKFGSQWLQFLLYCMDIKDKLSLYDAQSNKELYNVRNITEWGRPGMSQGINITADNFEEFAEKLADTFGITPNSTLELLKDVKEDWTTNLEVLNGLLQVLLNTPVNCSFVVETSVTTICEGPFIFITQIFNNTSIRQDTETLVLLSTSTVFFDGDVDGSDINPTNNVAVTIIAPTWHLVRTVAVDLGGPAVLDMPGEADRGKEGAAGKAGNPGGNFIGVFLYSNGGQLRINSSGGMGGTGQTGGQGLPGDDLKELDWDTAVSDWEGSDVFNIARNNSGDRCIPFMQIVRNGTTPFQPPDKYKLTETVEGHNNLAYFFDHSGNSNGGPGFGGGKGGLGGLPGYVSVIQLKNHSVKLSTTSEVGQEGYPGFGGRGGAPGNRHGFIRVILTYALGKACKAYYNDPLGPLERKSIDFHNRTCCWWWHLVEPFEKYTNDSALPLGPDGSSGSSSILQDPQKPTFSSRTVASHFIRYFSIVVTSSIFFTSDLSHFTRIVYNNTSIQHLFTSISYYDELEDLLHLFYQYKEQIDFRPHFQALLDKIHLYILRFPTEDERTAIIYLYTTVLNIIFNLGTVYNPTLVTEIEAYLKIQNETITQLVSLKKEEQRKNLIETITNEYKEDFDSRIEEANKLISGTVRPEIEQCFATFKKLVSDLLDEIADLERNEEAYKDKLKEKREQLRNIMQWSWVLPLLNDLGAAAGVLGPVGAAVGAGLELAAGVAETLKKDIPSPGPPTTTILPNSALSTMKSEETVRRADLKKLTGGFEAQLDDIKEAVIMCKVCYTTEKILNETLEEFKKVKSGFQMDPKDSRILTYSKEYKYFVQTYSFMQTRIHMIYSGANEDYIQNFGRPKEKRKRSTEIGLSNNLSNSKGRHQQARKVTAEAISKGVEATRKALKIGPDIYMDWKKNDGALRNLENAVNHAGANLLRLRNHREKIWTHLVPIFNDLEENMGRVMNGLPALSESALDVEKWRIQDLLRDLKLTIEKQYAAGVPGYMGNTIEKLQAGLEVMIGIYERLEKFREQKKLANYIAAIQTSYSSVYDIRDKVLQNATLRAEMAILINLVNVRHETFMRSFKMWVFPFAHQFVGEFQFPAKLFPADAAYDFENLLIEMTQKTQTLRQHVVLYNTGVVPGIDNAMAEVNFDSGAGQDSYFNWLYRLHSQKIDKLIQGETITLEASAYFSGYEYDCIKFKSLVLYLVTSKGDQQLDKEIAEILRYYRYDLIPKIKMTYRFNEKFYSVPAPIPHMQYTRSFTRGKNDTPEYCNNVCQQIYTGGYIISPYSVWDVKLYPANKSNSVNLSKYKQVNLKLRGEGYAFDSSQIDYEAVKNIDNYYIEDYNLKESLTLH